MKVRHVLLEVFCEGDHSESSLCCKAGLEHPGYHCLAENCPNVSFTCAPHELAYSDEFGVVPDTKAWIGFGGDMLPEEALDMEPMLKELWGNICKKKIQEAYDEYMAEMKKITEDSQFDKSEKS